MYRNMEGRYTRLSNDAYVSKLKDQQKKLKAQKKEIKDKKWAAFDQIYKDGYDRKVQMYQSWMR